jgi:hypothetical protein
MEVPVTSGLTTESTQTLPAIILNAIQDAYLDSGVTIA